MSQGKVDGQMESVNDSRKRPLDGESDTGTTKRSNQGSGEYHPIAWIEPWHLILQEKIYEIWFVFQNLKNIMAEIFEHDNFVFFSVLKWK